jgi:diazepam-binding inhibitor (GABA receptor modulating acyl-CoA-binding protein)
MLLSVYFLLLLQEDFDKAAEDAKTLPDNTSNDDKLALYGLFKQATVGDVNTGAVRWARQLQQGRVPAP